MRVAILAALPVLALAGCAGTPARSHGPAAGAVRSSAVAPAIASSAAEPQTVQQRAAAEAAIRAGYHVKLRQGQRLYCREETPIGTRFSEEHCFTIEQLTAAQRNEDRLHDMLAKPRTCGGSTCVAQ
jgi:hypothetical protein